MSLGLLRGEWCIPLFRIELNYVPWVITWGMVYTAV